MSVFATRKAPYLERAERITKEARDLWLEVFGAPPGDEVDEGRMLEILLRRMEAKAYTRLTPAARSRNLTFPD